ncbi:T9SS type A sorting domain-containing protein [Flavobacteriaceae bacterium]|nr:T9SS type A sorting domain-containing protein [Flavobacteriaceae bacterium]
MRFTLLLLSLLSMHFVAAQNAQGGFGNDISTEKLNFQLYPNPYIGGKLHIVSQPTGVKNVVILNILGEVVFQITTYEDYVMPNNLVSGIYIVNIQQGSQQGLSRLVVP